MTMYGSYRGRQSVDMSSFIHFHLMGVLVKSTITSSHLNVVPNIINTAEYLKMSTVRRERNTALETHYLGRAGC